MCAKGSRRAVASADSGEPVGYGLGMALVGGDGWARCDLGHRHWGRFGAAGLLGYARDDSGQTQVLLQYRSWWSSHGGTWGLFGGARLRHEPSDAAALREAAEESTLREDAVRVRGILRDDHGGWSYETVIAELPRPILVEPASPETAAAAWVAAGAVSELELHPGFAAFWPILRGALRPVVIIVDAANVMGARADGWWRDRAAAARRLRDELTALGARGFASWPGGVAVPRLDVWFPELVLVVEGAARGGFGRESTAAGRAGCAARDRAARDGAGRDGVRVVAAKGLGDDTIAELAATEPGIRLVVTADRELRRRCEAAGASVVGPRWLLGLL